MTNLINRNQVVENGVTGSQPENQISKVRLTDWAKSKNRAGNRLPSRIPTPRKRYCMSYFFVQWYRAWLIDARQTGEKVLPADKEDYLVVKSRGRISFMNKEWIAVCERSLCGDLNALLHIAVIFTTHRKRNVVIFYINFSFMKVFKKN